MLVSARMATKSSKTWRNAHGQRYMQWLANSKFRSLEFEPPPHRTRQRISTNVAMFVKYNDRLPKSDESINGHAVGKNWARLLSAAAREEISPTIQEEVQHIRKNRKRSKAFELLAVALEQQEQEK